ncbi:MAG: NUDIX domain-containing protein [Haloarculaceae archaeon]
MSMGVGEQSRRRIRERLDRLEQRYGSFPVNQTTLRVPREAYERAVDRSESGLADVYVEVRDDDDVLFVRGDDAWQLPHGQTEAGESLEAGARRLVRESTGVDVRIDGLVRATIAGLRNGADPNAEPVYRLVVVFIARATESIDSEDARWRESSPAVETELV